MCECGVRVCVCAIVCVCVCVRARSRASTVHESPSLNFYHFRATSVHCKEEAYKIW